MSNATVRANDRTLSKAKRPATAPAPAFDPIKARAKWSAAVAKYTAADARYTAMCRAMDAAMPKTLLDVEDISSCMAAALGKDDFDVVGVLRACKAHGLMFWSDDASSELGTAHEIAAARKRAEEIIAATDAWDVERRKFLKPIYKEEDRLAHVLDEQDRVAADILAAPASAEALQLKLDLFRHLYSKEGDEPLNCAEAKDVAAAIVLDILAMGCGEAGEFARAA